MPWASAQKAGLSPQQEYMEYSNISMTILSTSCAVAEIGHLKRQGLQSIEPGALCTADMSKELPAGVSLLLALLHHSRSQLCSGLGCIQGFKASSCRALCASQVAQQDESSTRTQGRAVQMLYPSLRSSWQGEHSSSPGHERTALKLDQEGSRIAIPPPPLEKG